MKHILARVSGLILLLSMILTPLATGATGNSDLSLVSLTLNSDTDVPQAFSLTSLSLKGHYTSSDPAAKLTDTKAAEDLSKSLQDFVLVSFIIPGGEYNTIGASSTDSSLHSGDDFEFRYIGFFTSTGSKKLTFSIDAQNAVAESNETNNTLSQDVVVAPLDPIYQTLPITDISASEISKESAVLSWKTADPAQSLLFYWPDKLGAIAEVAGLDLEQLLSMTTSNALLIPDLSANTDYKYLIMAGNTGATGVSAVQSFRTNNQEMAPIPDSEKIIFSDIKSEIVNSYSVTITWKTNIPTASKVSYRPTKPCVSDFLCDMDRSQYSKDVTTSHSLSLPLYPADTYTYHIEAQLSPSKPIQKSETLTVVTTDPVIDVPPIPVVEPDPIDNVGPNIISGVKIDRITNRQAVVSWTTSKKSYSYVDYGAAPFGADGKSKVVTTSVLDDNFSTHHELLLKKLEPGTDYSFVLSATETAWGDITRYPEVYYFKTLVDGPAAPVIPPIGIKNVTTKYTDHKLTIKWETEKPAYSIVSLNRACIQDQLMVHQPSTGFISQHFDTFDVVILDSPDCKFQFVSVEVYGSGDEVVSPEYKLEAEGISDNSKPPTLVYPIGRVDSQKSVMSREKNRLTKTDASLVNKLRGRLLLQTEEKGEAWYLDPVSGRRFYMQDGVGAYEALRSFGLGISNKDLEQIPVGVLWDDALKGDIDSDHDGLADKLESALGTDPYNTDSDNDSYTDGQEVRNGYSPLGSPKVKVNAALVKKLAGRILIQADHKGEAWYINPVDGHRYFLGNGEQAYQLMRRLALGIGNSNLNKIPVGN